MADFDLILGDVTFFGFEIPDSIRAGGGQALDIKKYAGGVRTIDTFGPDDDPITWSGIFLDDTAEARCQQLDAMRIAGAQVQLSFSSFSYLVVISKFTFEFQKYYQIPYSIELEVVDDQTQPVTDNGDDLESDMQSDLDAANNYATGLGDSIFGADFNTVLSDLTGMPSIAGGTVPQLLQLGNDLSTAQGRAQTLSIAADTAMNQIGLPINFRGGINGTVMAGNLQSLASTALQLPNAFGASNTLTKLGKSVSSILGF